MWFMDVVGAGFVIAGRFLHYLLQLVQLRRHEESFFIGTAKVFPQQFGFCLLDVGRQPVGGLSCIAGHIVED